MLDVSAAGREIVPPLGAAAPANRRALRHPAGNVITSAGPAKNIGAAAPSSYNHH